MSGKKKRIRNNFRDIVFSRDCHKCAICGAPEVGIHKLDAHHITDRNFMPNGGYVQENGISLCDECHIKAEKFHQTNGKEWEMGFHPNDLYDKISSSYEKAVKASERL